MKAAVARFVWRVAPATGRAHVPLRTSPERAVCNRRVVLADMEASPDAHRCLLCANRANHEENGAMWGLQVGEPVGAVKQKADPMGRSPRPSSSSEASRLARARDRFQEGEHARKTLEELSENPIAFNEVRVEEGLADPRTALERADPDLGSDAHKGASATSNPKGHVPRPSYDASPRASARVRILARASLEVPQAKPRPSALERILAIVDAELHAPERSTNADRTDLLRPLVVELVIRLVAVEPRGKRQRPGFQLHMRLAWERLAKALAEVARARTAGPVPAETREELRRAQEGVSALGFGVPYEPELGAPEELASALEADRRRHERERQTCTKKGSK